MSRTSNIEPPAEKKLSVFFSSILSKQLVLAIRVGLTVLIVSHTVSQVNWQGLKGTLQHINPVKMVTAICLQGCAIVIATTRWRMLLASGDVSLSWSRTARLTLIGLFFNLFFLGSLTGDAAKFVGSIPHAPERKTRLALSLVQDRLIGLGGLLILMTGFIIVHWPLLCMNLTTRPLAIVIPGTCAAYIAVAATLWIAHTPNAVENPKDFWHWRNMTFQAVHKSFPKSVFVPAMALSVVIHAVVIFGGYLAARAVGIGISLTAAGVVMGTTALILSLPITVAGLGVRDGILVWLLGTFGSGATEQAIGLSACLLGINLFWAFAGGVAFYWPSHTIQIPNQTSG